MTMNGSVIIWDIETIPDLQGFAAVNYLVGKTDAEIREVMDSQSTSITPSSASAH